MASSFDDALALLEVGSRYRYRQRQLLQWQSGQVVGVGVGVSRWRTTITRGSNDFEWVSKSMVLYGWRW